MKILTIDQPWASLICMGIMYVGNRLWNTSYRGKVLIHASGNKVPADFLAMQPMEYMEELLNERSFGNLDFSFESLPTNAIIGTAEITDVFEAGDVPYQ